MPAAAPHLVIETPLDRGLRPAEAYARLPIAFEVEELAARWLGPLIDKGYEPWMGDLGQAGWGYLEGCGWSDLLPGEALLTPQGELSPAWKRGLHAAAHCLADSGRISGPESDPSVWLSWICFAMSSPRDYIRQLAEG